ncbi:adenylate/guanylate cyclase domain-containing protein [Bacteriovoracaceae bacterium]|nr:adenylate/guanylate cyclase domain-containing protein [Bacteriovoracaceae bacterium]
MSTINAAKYFDLDLFLRERELKEFFNNFNVEIHSIYNQIFFKNGRVDMENIDGIDIIIDQQHYAVVYSEDQDRDLICTMLSKEIKFYNEELKKEALIEQENILAKDIDELLEMTSSQKISNIEALKTLLSFLSSHFPFERCSIYIENVKKDLGHLCGIRNNSEFYSGNLEEEILEDDTIASVAFYNQKIYILDNPSENSLFKNDPEKTTPKNFSVFPIYYFKTSLGVLNISNCYLKNYSPYDIKIINRVIKALGHIIYQIQLKEYIDFNQRVSNDLKSYVSSSIYTEIVNTDEDEGKSELSQAKVEHAVCLFADIRSFTSLSEKLDPAELVRLLNVYFDTLSPVIIESGGTIDKYVGDMISAFWNIPRKIKDPEVVAVKAAIKMQKLMVDKVAPVWKDAGVPYMGIGLGLASGKVLCGNFGSKTFNNYTAIGDSCEFAQFLESKARPGEIWISEKLFLKVKNTLPAPKRVEHGLTYMKKRFNIPVFKPSDYPDYTKSSS